MSFLTKIQRNKKYLNFYEIKRMYVLVLILCSRGDLEAVCELVPLPKIMKGHDEDLEHVNISWAKIR